MPSRASDARAALSVAGIAALAFLAWRGVLELALLGWDSYPLILAGRVRSAGELWGTFGEELMDGAYPLGRFWRPVVHLSFGLDHAIYGLAPAGYHATGLVLLALSGVTLFFLARRLIGSGARLGPLVASVVFVLHPVQLEVVTVPARRAETLCVLFTLLALLAQPLAPSPRATGRAWLAGACCALALASKETGAMAVGLVLCLAFAAAREERHADRLGSTLRSAWPALALFVLALGVRTLALGGLGGSAQSSLSTHWGALPGILRGYLSALAAPASTLGLSRELAGDLAIALIVATLWVLTRSKVAVAREQESAPGLPARSLGLFLVLATLVVAFVTSVSGLLRGWYALPFLPLYCLALGSMVDLGLRGLRTGPRIAAALALLVALHGLGSVLPPSKRAEALEPLLRGSRDERAYLERFDAAVESAAPGSTVVVPGLPTERRVDPADPESLNVLMLAPYSVEAYARLRFPDRKLRLDLAGGAAVVPPQLDEVVVLLAP